MNAEPEKPTLNRRLSVKPRACWWQEAQEIVSTLARRLSPEEMHVWLAHHEKAHPIPDESTNATLGMTLHWTAVGAIEAGNTGLVIAEARRFTAA